MSQIKTKFAPKRRSQFCFRRGKKDLNLEKNLGKALLFLLLSSREGKDWKDAAIQMTGTKDCFHCHENKNKAKSRKGDLI